MQAVKLVEYLVLSFKHNYKRFSKYFQGAEDGGLEVIYCESFLKTYEEEEFNIAPKMQEYQLMTSISGPAFDHKINKGNEVIPTLLLT